MIFYKKLTGYFELIIIKLPKVVKAYKDNMTISQIAEIVDLEEDEISKILTEKMN